MKLIIQIPCFNEEKTLAETLKDLPTEIAGVDIIETQIIDDGSTDNTVEIAKSLGVNHIITFKNNKGLAAAFKAGADNAINCGADILVNTDGDNQYYGPDIAKLVVPILKGQADIVIGTRPIKDHPEFSFIKKILQGLGSSVLRSASGTTVKDAASGFRAYSVNSLLQLNIYTKFSYCMETLIQAGRFNMKVESVDIGVNPKTRESRLFKNIFQYVYKSGSTIVGVYLVYSSRAFFFLLSAASFLGSLGLVLRYLVLTTYFDSPKAQFWPTIILAGILLAVSIQFALTGIVASLISSNRKLLEEINYRQRKQSLKNKDVI